MHAAEHHLFFSRDLRGDVVHLDAEEARHAVRVLRLRPGDRLRVTDGTGVVRECTLADAGREGATARVTATQTHPRTLPALVLHIGIPERAALESAVEAAAALGVTGIVPVVCEYCQSGWWERSWEKEAARLERKMVAAIKQSLNPYLPVLSPPSVFTAGLAAATGTIVVADPEGQDPRAIALPGTAETVHAFVGPPGGFSPAEQDALARRGALKVRLSPHRLRTELAAIALAILLMAPR